MYDLNIGEKGLRITKQFRLNDRKPDSKNRQGFDSSDAIYLVMPDRFANGDPAMTPWMPWTEKANREDRGGRHGGDIQGIIDHLGLH